MLTSTPLARRRGGSWRRGLRKCQRERVAVVRARQAALLHVRLAFQHQQVAPVNVIPRARQVRRKLFVLLDRAVLIGMLFGDLEGDAGS
jgi:hypothetical protein